MTRQTPQHRNGEAATTLEPIFISVKEAARMLNLTPWSMYQILDAEKVEARYFGRRRMVVLASLREFAKSLPTERPEAS
jgi:hypothetical protein